jgi:hypothetical protein
MLIKERGEKAKRGRRKGKKEGQIKNQKAKGKGQKYCPLPIAYRLLPIAYDS